MGKHTQVLGLKKFTLYGPKGTLALIFETPAQCSIKVKIFSPSLSGVESLELHRPG